MHVAISSSLLLEIQYSTSVYVGSYSDACSMRCYYNRNYLVQRITTFLWSDSINLRVSQHPYLLLSVPVECSYNN